MSYPARHRRRHRGHPARSTGLVALLVLMIVAGLAALGVVSWVVATAASAPPLASLKQKDRGQASGVPGADGARLGFTQADERRQPVPDSQLPDVLKRA